MNRLARETSAYLRDHADQPVDWYPWGDEAWTRARSDDKPIFLSIGYSACHWCHVMARESFEDKEVARILNESFVSIKVDREERPDVDEIYIEAVRILNSSAGWPLNVFLTPELEPFYGGTYFPPEPRSGLPAFRRVLLSVAAHFQQYRDEIDKAGATITEKLNELSRLPEHEGELGPEPLATFVDHRNQAFDSEHGGFGIAPKFPGPVDLLMLLRLARKQCDGRPAWPQARAMVELTLRNMARGGIYDQLGGGFHRYSTDTIWLVPHFEKMLYDNSLLALAYAEAYLLTGDDSHAAIARETLAFVEREMTAPDGGFIAALDADTDGTEGGHYLWTPDQVSEAVGPELAPLALELYGVAEAGSFHGRNVLHLGTPVEVLLARHRLDETGFWSRVGQIRERMTDARSQRVPPRRDEKVLADWNGLALSAFARAHRLLGDRHLLDVAAGLGRAVHERLVRGRDVIHLARPGQDDLPGGLADYALVARGMLDLFESNHDYRHLESAVRLAERMIELFADPAGGFFTVRTDAPGMITRTKSGYDGAIPSGNSVAASLLLRLARLTARPEFERTAVAAIRRFYPIMASHPSAFSEMLGALDYLLTPGSELALFLPPGDPESDAFRDWLRANPDPYRTTAVVRGDRAGSVQRTLVPLLEDRSATGGRATAFLCRDLRCLGPVHSAAELDRQVRDREPDPA